MNRIRKSVVPVLLCAVIVLITFIGSSPSLALTDAQKSAIQNKISKYQQENQKLANEIAQLKSKQGQQEKILKALNDEITNIQAIINAYNAEINRINTVIAENKAKIAQKETEIEADKLEFKKRIRAIYMSGWDSSLKVLLSANDFSEYLQLQKLTEAVSKKDKQFMEKLSAEIDELDAINAENQTLLESQVELKNEVKKQQDELKARQDEATKLYNEISKEIKADNAEKSANDAAIAKLKADLEADIAKQGNSAATFINPNTGFMWPVAGYYSISSGFRTAKRPTHNGMDIAGSGISGKPILAIADGVVYIAVSNWTAAMGKRGNASYGNYCAVNHGTMTIKGTQAKYVAFYAHATKIIVSVNQKVKQGQVLGYVGTTGNSTGPHLHIGIQKNGSWVNPYPLLKG
ncbi:MAG: peptidoglycan DD-metalloendopeptidase family protein [Clostridia bacterium]|nr:peptidoglycan DD-metalloendopeptidase family protein [Clostridia bacterium]